MVNEYSKAEETANVITHLLGAGIAMAAIAILAVRASIYGNYVHVVSFVIAGSALLLLYSMSSVYHMLPVGKGKDLFKRLDHCAIFILIAGSYTPYLLTVIDGKIGWWIFGIQWGLTLVGILFKLKYAGRFNFVSTLVYLFMGWMIVFVFKDLKNSLNPVSLKLLVASGITYSVGALIYLIKGVQYTHAVWHIFVVCASILGVLSVYYSVG